MLHITYYQSDIRLTCHSTLTSTFAANILWHADSLRVCPMGTQYTFADIKRHRSDAEFRTEIASNYEISHIRECYFCGLLNTLCSSIVYSSSFIPNFCISIPFESCTIRIRTDNDDDVDVLHSWNCLCARCCRPLCGNFCSAGSLELWLRRCE